MSCLKYELSRKWWEAHTTQYYKERVYAGEKSAEDYAGEYLYYFEDKDKAVDFFVRECYLLEEDFKKEIVYLIATAK